MPVAPLPDQEYARLLELARYDILDSLPEETFDRLTRLTARTLRVSSVALNFLDQDRQWCKSAYGSADTTGPREDALCAWTILSDEVLAVPDTRQDPRFFDNSMVVGAQNVQMYAGAPLITPMGYRIGSLCVFGTEPRELDTDDQSALQDLATLVVDELELRLHARALENRLEHQSRQMQDLRQTVEHARVLEQINGLLDTDLSPQDVTLEVARCLGEAIHADWTGLMALRGENLSVQVAHHQPEAKPDLLAFANRVPTLPGGVTRSLQNLEKTVYLDDYAQHPAALQEGIDAGLKAAAWVPLGQYGDTSYLLNTLRAEHGTHAAWRASDRALLDAAGRSVRAALIQQSTLLASEWAARQDALTGIPNRRAFDEDLAGRVQAGQPFTLALMDLDGFKQVNDVEGHAQGDRVLQVFATTLHNEIRDYGGTYRYGGDEFALMVDSLIEDETLEHVDIAILAARQVTALPLGASTGVVEFKEAGSIAELLGQADERLYEVKRRRQALHAGTTR